MIPSMPFSIETLAISSIASFERSGAIFTSKGGQLDKSLSVLINFFICFVSCNDRRPGVLGELTLITA